MRGAGRALLLALVLLGCGPPQGSDIVSLRSMELWLGPSAKPPMALDSEWQTVSMPDTWGLGRRLRSLEGWYRGRFTMPAARTASEPLAVYLPGFSGHVTVYWNGERLGDSGPYREDDTRHVRGPLLLQVPEAWVGAGDDVLYVRFRATASVPDYLRAPIVGPRSKLLPAYEQKLAFSRQLPLIFSLAGIVVAVLLMVVYWKDPDARSVAWLSAGLLCGSLAVTGVFADNPLPARLVEPLRPSLYQFSVVCFAFALHRIRGLRRRRLERWMLGVSAGFAALAFAVPPIFTYAVAVVWSIPTAALCVYVGVLLVGVARTLSGTHALAALFPLVGVGLFAVHDVAGIVTGHFLFDQVLLVYASGMITLGLVSVHLTRTRMALAESRSLNRELDARVAEKRAELERNFERLRAIEREQVVLAERERMLRDMHDGLGGQLVSTLAMVESGRFEPEELAEALRDSLDDLRLMVHSLDPSEADLLSMLAVVRERVEPRLARRGLRFAWHVEDVPDLPALEPAGVLQVLRIVQEVITNIVKHADASTITLRTGTCPASGTRRAHVFLSIHDDGVGLPPSPRRGRGLTNMRERARLVDAEIEIVSPASGSQGRAGTRVTLRLPLA